MKKTKATVDRFEGDFAVVIADSISIDIPKGILPEDAKEGDVIYIRVTNDEEETKSQGELARSLLNEVLKEE
ncbi:MAG: DUF3006 domain-containing protein [bacterium]|nr:DUF3006 domain-containing protein [bacterium]